MKREHFDHAIRAAAAVLGVDDLVVIGSQAVHASMTEPLPEAAERSVEVDVVPPDDPDGVRADLIDGSIGEASMFHETFGYYSQGVAETTAILPRGWRERLVRYESPATNGVTAWCLDLHDLWISKAIAGREKDRDFCQALLVAGAVEAAVLGERLSEVDRLSRARRDAVHALLRGSAPEDSTPRSSSRRDQ